MTTIVEQMSFGFLGLAIALFVSVAYLFHTMSEGRKRWSQMPEVF